MTPYLVVVGGCWQFAATYGLYHILDLEMADSSKITGCRKINLMALEL
jgi:hypothetical protein